MLVVEGLLKTSGRICRQAESTLYDVTASLAEASAARKDFSEVSTLSRLCWASAYAS